MRHASTGPTVLTVSGAVIRPHGWGTGR